MSNLLCKDVLVIIMKYKKAFEVFEKNINKENMERTFRMDFFNDDNVVIHRIVDNHYHIRYYLVNAELNILVGIIRYQKYKLIFCLNYYFNQQKILMNKINEIRKYG